MTTAPATNEPAPEAAAAEVRGPITVPLDGADFALCPSRAAISAIERQTRPLFVLGIDAARGALSLDDMAIIVTEMMRARGAAVPDDPMVNSYRGASVERVADLIFEAGQPRICARIMLVLGDALAGGYTADGHIKAAND